MMQRWHMFAVEANCGIGSHAALVLDISALTSSRQDLLPSNYATTSGFLELGDVRRFDRFAVASTQVSAGIDVIYSNVQYLSRVG